MGKYDDIINLPHHLSETHPRMTLLDRAAQFSPFAALTGHGDAIRETSRLTDPKTELAEERKALLDRRLQAICSAGHPEVSITYFVQDRKKDGGAVVTAEGAVKKIDSIEKMVVFYNGNRVLFDDILLIEGNLFRGELDR